MSDWTRFKTEINLSEYAAFLGYEIVKKDTTRSSIKMRRGSDIVIISKKGGTWIYFSVSGQNDNGTIVNFIQNRTGQSLAEIAKDLLEWLGEDVTRPEPKFYVQDVVEQEYDPQRVNKIFKGCKVAKNHQYLEGRGITGAALCSKRFAGRIYTDHYKNAAFPHYNDNGVCGIELKNADTALFVRGSEKTLWRSNFIEGDDTLIISEAVIDALSYHLVHCSENSFYVATGGGMSPDQEALIEGFIEEALWIKKIIIITDNDLGGDKLAERVRTILKDCCFNGAVRRHSPKKIGYDWNDVLKSSNIPN